MKILSFHDYIVLEIKFSQVALPPSYYSYFSGNDEIVNFNSKGKEEVSYDAIVVGTGISGGWAAKELCEKGLKTLVLEKGRDVKHPDYPTAADDPWDYPNLGRLSEKELEDYPKQNRTGYTIQAATKHWWVKDSEHPYSEVKRFDWMRGHHVGGRSLMWGRQSYRLSDLDFEANLLQLHL